jgi:hypothetical protein
MYVGAVLGILQLTAVVVGLLVLGRSWWLAHSALKRWAAGLGRLAEELNADALIRST